MRCHRIKLWSLVVALTMMAASAVAGTQHDAFMAISRQLTLSESVLMIDPAAAMRGALVADAQIAARPESKQRTIMSARANWLRGAALVQLNRSAEALPVLNRALSGGLLTIEPRSKLAGDLLMARGFAEMVNGQVEGALPDLQHAFRIYAQLGESRSQSLALLNIGSIYAMARDFNRALNYYSQAAEVFKSDPALLVALYDNKAHIFMDQEKYSSAEASSAAAVQEAAKMGSVVLQARYLGSLALAQLKLHKVDQADTTIARAFALSRGAPLGDWSTSLQAAAAEVAYERGQLDRASTLITAALRGKDIARSDLSQRDQLATAYRIAKARGESKRALTYLEAFKQVDDKARTLAASTNAALMSAKFDFANQDIKIGMLRKGEAERDATIAKARARFLVVLLAAAGSIAGLLAFAYVSLRRSRDEVRAANADLSTSNVALEKALAARTAFLAMTSHEIRTPLNGILGMTQVLLADRATSPDVRERIELVHGAGETMKALVDDLLDVAKMATGEIAIRKEPMDLARLLGDAGRVWQDQAQARGLTLALDIADLPPRIVEDEVRLRQVVFNLMANAIKFTDQGEVRLTATVVPGADTDAGERLRIAVSDSGIGIPEDQIEAIFESFRQVDGGTTRRHGGTGLGLSICRSVARALGGDVTATSIIGVGSTFLLDLPLERAVAEDQPAEIAEPARGLAAATLLLVDANPLNQSVLRAVLGPRLARLVGADSVDEARARLAADRPQIVIADGVTLGLDIALVAQVAQAAARHGAAFGLFWPSPDEATRAALRMAGLPPPIAKPIATPDLVAAIEEMYTLSSGAQPAAVAA